jgi:PPM family protein phosphatase
MFKLSWGSVCIKGNFRDNNEDNLHVHPHSRLFLVADGMGGQNAGEKASAIATDLIPRRLNEILDQDDLTEQKITAGIDEAVRYANTEIMALSEQDPKCRNMGTTIVLLVAVNNNLYIGGIGDSRAYQFRGDNFDQQTIDHTLTEALRRAGTINDEEARNHRYQNVLHRYLGSPEGAKGVELAILTPRPGDRYLLCSDGVTGGVDDERIAQILKTTSDPQQAAEEIVKAAEAGGSKDNITCIVVNVEPAS